MSTSFFGKSLSSKQIEINTDATCADTPEMVARLDRIENNYAKLSDILSDLEKRFEMDDRLAAMIEESNDLPKKPR